MVVGDFAIELDTVVVGSGPGGYVAAIRAAQLGQKVSLIEKGDIGGVCLNIGCIPSKALVTAGKEYYKAQHLDYMGITTQGVDLDFTKLQEWKDKQVVSQLTGGVEMLLKKHKVEIIKGEAFFQNEHHLRVITDEGAQSYSFNHAIVATGSRPIELKEAPFKGRVIDSTQALNLKELPEDLVVVGSDYIGVELATAYAQLGTQVTILEEDKQILPTYEKDLAKLVERSFKDLKAQVTTQAKLVGVEEKDDKVIVTYERKGKEEKIEASYCLISAGRRPNTDELGLEVAGIDMDDAGLVKVDKQGRTNKKSVFAIGDIVAGQPLAHKASYEGKIAAAAISGDQSAEVDYLAIPEVCFAALEIATVGHTQASAKAEGLEVTASKFPLGANGRAISLNETSGFVRLVTTQEDNILVGAQVAGPHASDIISELSLAIEAGMNAEDLTLTLHFHPSIGEAIMDTAELALGQGIHV